MLETQKGAADRSGFGPEANHPQSTSRRRVILGGAALVPTVVTLASRPALAGGRHAWAGRCTISGWASLNPSVMDAPLECKGASHGYWKNHERAWKSTGFRPGPKNPTLYHEAIGVLTPTYYDGHIMTLMEALRYGNREQREFANAVLNAAKWGPEYGYTLEEMRDLIALRSSDPTFIDDLEELYKGERHI